jgi:hypothetical protein
VAGYRKAYCDTAARNAYFLFARANIPGMNWAAKSEFAVTAPLGLLISTVVAIRVFRDAPDRLAQFSRPSFTLPQPSVPAARFRMIRH